MWCDAERQERLQLKARIEGWIEQQTEPVLYRHGRRVDRLSQVRFSLDCVVKNLVLNCRIRGTEPARAGCCKQLRTISEPWPFGLSCGEGWKSLKFVRRLRLLSHARFWKLGAIFSARSRI